MVETLATAPDLFAEPAYLPRITQRDGRAIEEALAGPTLFDPGVRLDAAIVEATYAAANPPLLKRLREEGVPQLIDPQTTRFTGERFLTVEQFGRLPYRPTAQIEAGSFGSSDAQSLARGVMLYQQAHGAAWYLAAALPHHDTDPQSWLRHNDRLLSASCEANGSSDLDRRPLVAQVVPGMQALANPTPIINRLLDYPVDAVYVQPTRLDPTKDSVEKLVQYVEFLRAIRLAGLPVIAGRVGAFGLILLALGISAFDSGLALAETCDLASLNRAPTERELARRTSGGLGRRIYLEQLKTTLAARHAAAILAERSLRGRFVCSLACCQHNGFEHLPERHRQHYLWTRSHEVKQIRALPTEAMRLNLMHEQLRDAREIGAVVRRALGARGSDIPSFDHVERWRTVLAREMRMLAVA